MPRNLLQLLQETQTCLYKLRLDTHATRTDVIDDMEQRVIELMQCVVSTPSVYNFVLPIDDFDHNDVFLRPDTVVASEV
jgi:hypothetical protein